MAAKPTAKNAAKPTAKNADPITLDELVGRVFGTPGGGKPSGPARRGGLAARLRGVVSGRATQGAAEPNPNPKSKPQGPAPSGPDRSAWGLAPTPQVQRLMGLSSPSGWVPSLKLSPVFAADNPPATLCALRGAREAQAQGLRAAAAAWAEADHMRAVGLRAWVLHDLVRTFPDKQQRLLEVAEVTSLSMHRVLEQVPLRILEARKTSARVFEAPLARRVDAALALLASPAIRGAVPEAPALRPRALRLAKAATELAAVAARVEVLHRRRERLQTLTDLGRRLSDHAEMHRLLRWEEERLRGAIAELDHKAGALVYPEDAVPDAAFEAEVAAALAQALPVDDVYDLKHESLQAVSGGIDPLAPGLIDRLQDLNLRVLTDLAELTERVERGLKLAAVDPPARRSVA